jgi:hypothetical protein
VKVQQSLVSFSKWICFGCGEKGHYVNKCPQRLPNGQPTEIGIATPQCIQHSKNVQTLVVGSRKVQRSQATQNPTQTPPNKQCYNCEEKGQFAITCPNPCSHPPLPPLTKEVLRQLKRPHHVSIMDKLVILPTDALISVDYRPQPKATKMWHEL